MKQAVINAFYIDSSVKKVERIDAYAIPALKKDTDYIWLQLDFSASETRNLVESLQINDFWIDLTTKNRFTNSLLKIRKVVLKSMVLGSTLLFIFMYNNAYLHFEY